MPQELQTAIPGRESTKQAPCGQRERGCGWGWSVGVRWRRGVGARTDGARADGAKRMGQSKWGRYCYRPHSYRAWSSNPAPSCDIAIRSTWPPVSCLAHCLPCDGLCARLSHRRSRRHPVPVGPAFGRRHLRSARLSRYPSGSDAVCSVWLRVRHILRRPKPRVCHRSQAGTPSNSGWLSQIRQWSTCFGPKPSACIPQDLRGQHPLSRLS